MFSSALVPGLPEAAVRLKKPLQDPRGTWEENWDFHPHGSTWVLGATVSQRQPRASVTTRPTQVHVVLAGPHVCLANIHTHGLHVRKTRPHVKLQKSRHLHGGDVRAPRPSVNPRFPEGVCGQTPLPEGFVPYRRSVAAPALFGSHFSSFLEA